MLRGTTPTVTLTLPAEVDLSTATVAYMSFGQNGKDLFDVAISGLTLVGNTASATLTQAQTLMLEAGRMTQIQLRWLDDGVAYGTKIVLVPTDAIIKDGVIS